MAARIRAQRSRTLAELNRGLAAVRDELRLTPTAGERPPLTWRAMSLTTSSTRVVVKVRVRTMTGRPGGGRSTDAAMVVQVAVVAYRGSRGRRVRLDPVEEEGWARAVFGPGWEDAAYRGGHRLTGDGIGVAVFFLFLTAAGTPTRPPVGWAPPLSPLRSP